MKRLQLLLRKSYRRTFLLEWGSYCSFWSLETCNGVNTSLSSSKFLCHLSLKLMHRIMVGEQSCSRIRNQLLISKELLPWIQTKSIYEMKLIDVLLVVQKWRHYLLGRKLRVNSNQKALKFLIEQREVQPQFQKWLEKLLGYDFEILYQPSLRNKVVDALSRLNHPAELLVLSAPGKVDLNSFKIDGRRWRIA